MAYFIEPESGRKIYRDEIDDVVRYVDNGSVVPLYRCPNWTICDRAGWCYHWHPHEVSEECFEGCSIPRRKQADGCKRVSEQDRNDEKNRTEAGSDAHEETRNGQDERQDQDGPYR